MCAALLCGERDARGVVVVRCRRCASACALALSLSGSVLMSYPDVQGVALPATEGGKEKRRKGAEQSSLFPCL